jgi:pyruvate dehydrogenase (quinone)
VVDAAVPLSPPEPAFADLRAVFDHGEAARRVREHVELTVAAEDLV